MTDDAATLYQPAKAVFQRKRPPVGNTKPICVPREKWIETDGSYPSGHGLIGWSWALVISEVAPEHASAVLARGREFGDSRIICGVHYQSDIEAGRYLGSAMVSRLHQDPAFMSDLEKAKAEVAASRAKGAPTGCGRLTLAPYGPLRDRLPPQGEEERARDVLRPLWGRTDREAVRWGQGREPLSLGWSLGPRHEHHVRLQRITRPATAGCSKSRAGSWIMPNRAHHRLGGQVRARREGDDLVELSVSKP
jgi:hypothetical protein